MTLSRRATLMLGAAAALPSWRGVTRAQAQGTAQGDAWPSRSVRIVVPFGAGGSADVYARLLAERLTEALGQSFVVENRPGGGAVIGTDVAAKAAPDGYTVLMMSNTNTANETLIAHRPYDLMRDLAPAAAVNIAHHVLVVHPALAVRDVAGLVALAKSKPGGLDYASSGPGTPYHIAGAVFCAMAGIEMQHIPFRGSNEARTAVIGGQVPIMFDAIPTMLPHIQENRVRALATTGPEPDPLLPTLPTVAATIPGYEASIWLGLMVPTGTPAPIVARLHDAVNGILAQPATRAAMAQQGSVPMSMDIAAFDRFLRHDIAVQREYVRMARIEPQ